MNLYHTIEVLGSNYQVGGVELVGGLAQHVIAHLAVLRMAWGVGIRCPSPHSICIMKIVAGKVLVTSRDT